MNEWMVEWYKCVRSGIKSEPSGIDALLRYIVQENQNHIQCLDRLLGPWYWADDRKEMLNIVFSDLLEI